MKLKHLLFSAVAVAALLFGACHKDLGYGTYNIGVCTPTKNLVAASTVDFEADTFTVLGDAEGPQIVNKREHPLIFKFQKETSQGRLYVGQVNGHEDTVVIQVRKGELFGTFTPADINTTATLHGHKGTFDTLGQDGTGEYDYCTGGPADEQN